jgi:hypothetical protein
LQLIINLLFFLMMTEKDLHFCRRLIHHSVENSFRGVISGYDALGMVGGNLKGRTTRKSYRRLEDKIRSRVGRCGLDSSGSGLGPVAGSCELGNELSGSIKGRKFLG